jgi:hypothetical protein
MSAATYPVHVDATLEPRLSRWLWLVKWFLAIPHYVVLAFLWIAFVVVSVVAFFAILFTGRYPRGMFEFNVGVLRWSWRVSYYSFGALGTDRYPPFTLADVPDYPAHFDVDYPNRLSRGLVLVKWWLLAIPHYLVVAAFVGGGAWFVWETAGGLRTGAPGLIGLLVLIAAVVLAFTGRYPQQIFDFVLGMNRWALRVAAYGALMTDDYPPFRLDLGGQEPSGTMTLTGPTTPSEPTAPAEPTPPRRGGWTGGRVVSLVIGSLLGLVSFGLLAAGGVATWATNTQRDSAGYLTSDTRTFSTAAYAVTSEGIDLGSSSDWATPRDFLGTLRVRATATDPAKAVFIGVAPQSAVNTYLAGVDHLVVTGWTNGHTRNALVGGTALAAAPASSGIWTAQVSGTGTQSLSWEPTSGEWAIVVMNADGSAGVSVNADAAATVPDLAWIAVGLFAAGGVLLLIAVALVVVPVVRASR